jgi:DNA repair photolyase
MSRPWGDVVEVKVNIVDCLRKELAKGTKGVYGVGTVTDPYQPLEKVYGLTRGCLKLLKGAAASVSVLTKSDLVLRDIDILVEWKEAEVGLSLGCIDDKIASVVEPGAPSPSHRLAVAAELVRQGVDTYVMAAPILPGICDSEPAIERLASEVAGAGIRRIMWDGYNPKPIASKRFRNALETLGVGPTIGFGPERNRQTRLLLKRESERNGIHLTDAF